jgi:CBS domain-containing protein
MDTESSDLAPGPVPGGQPYPDSQPYGDTQRAPAPGPAPAPGQGIVVNAARVGQVADIMTPAPVGVYYTQTIGETARVMRDTQIGAVLVVNDGQLSGMVTDRDLVVRGLAEGMDPEDPVGPLCSGDLVGVAADAGVDQAEQLMREHAVRRLPVITDGQVVGIVSLGDIAVSVPDDSPLAAVSAAPPNI